MTAKLLVRLFATALLILSVPVVASAQTEEDHIVEGARDFRTAPVVTDGAYTDTILVGETLWYAVYLLNDDEKEFDVFTEVLLEDRDDMILEVAWIGPTLGTLDSGNEIEAAAFYYGSSNDGATWLWFLKFTVESETGALEEIPFRFTVTGAEAHDSNECSIADDCELALQASELESEIEQLEGVVAQGGGGNSEPETTIGPQSEVIELEEEISTLENELSSYLSHADGLRAAIAALETMADESEPSTSGGGFPTVLLYGIGVLALSVGVFLIAQNRSSSRR